MSLYGVDGNWYLHRVFHTQPEQSKDPASLMARRFLSMICKDAVATRCKNLVVAFDGDKIFRYDIYPSYKGERGEGSKVYDYLDGLKTYLDSAGIQVFHFPKYEADDVLCSIASQSTVPVVIGARDKDAFQYLRQGVRLYDSSNKLKGKPAPRYIAHTDVPVMLKGIAPEQCVDYQTLIGDAIDNVPQLVTPAKARKGIATYETLKSWIAADDAIRAELREKKEQLVLNRKLVKLKADLPIKIQQVCWKDVSDFPQPYADLKTFCNPKSRGLF